MKGISYFILSAVALLLIVVSISSCDKAKTSPAVPGLCQDTISFSGFVEQLIQQNCSVSGCHDAATASVGYNLEGHMNISMHAADILKVITHDPSVTPMPFGQPKLNDSIIEQCNCWDVQGKLDN